MSDAKRHHRPLQESRTACGIPWMFAAATSGPDGVTCARCIRWLKANGHADYFAARRAVAESEG